MKPRTCEETSPPGSRSQEAFLPVYHAWDWQSATVAIVGSYLLHRRWTRETQPQIGAKLGLDGQRVQKAVAKLEASGEVLRHGHLLMIRHERRRRGLFCRIPYWALHQLTPSEALLYGRIMAVERSLKHRCKDEHKPFIHSQKTFAEDLGYSENYVYKLFRSLQKRGLVAKKRVTRPLRRLGRLFIYLAIGVGSFSQRAEAIAERLSHRFHQRTYVTAHSHRKGPPSERLSRASRYDKASPERSLKAGTRGPPSELEGLAAFLEEHRDKDRDAATAAYYRFLDRTGRWKRKAKPKQPIRSPAMLEEMGRALEQMAHLDRDEALVEYCKFLDRTGSAPRQPDPDPYDDPRTRGEVETFDQYLNRVLRVRKPGNSRG